MVAAFKEEKRQDWPHFDADPEQENLAQLRMEIKGAAKLATIMNSSQPQANVFYQPDYLGAPPHYVAVSQAYYFPDVCARKVCSPFHVNCFRRPDGSVGVGLASADRVVVRIPAGPLGSLKCDPPKGNGRRPPKNMSIASDLWLRDAIDTGQTPVVVRFPAGCGDKLKDNDRPQKKRNAIDTAEEVFAHAARSFTLRLAETLSQYICSLTRRAESLASVGSSTPFSAPHRGGPG